MRERQDDDGDVGMEEEVANEEIMIAIHRYATVVFQRLIADGHIVNQTARLADFGHDVVAGINTKCAGDAFHLLPIPNVDPHRADGHTGHTIDAVALRLFGLYSFFQFLGLAVLEESDNRALRVESCGKGPEA